MISRRNFLLGAAAAMPLPRAISRASASEVNDVRQASQAALREADNGFELKAYLRSNPVGFDRLWLRRPSGEEIIALYRDQRAGLAVVPAQCLNLSYFWRDVHDRDVGVTVAVGLFDLLSRMQMALSTMAGKPVPLILTSGYRTPEHNAKIEGAAVNSEHLNARASDIVAPGFEPAIVSEAGSMLGAGGVGLYSRFTHVDVGKPGRRWKGSA